MAGWIDIVGIGEDGLDGLSAAARALLDSAEILVGGERHLAMIASGHPAERIAWRRPFRDSFEALRGHEGRRVVVLATGDPMYYGVGAKLAREMPEAIATVIPSPGAFSLAAARMGWSLADIGCLTLHGRARPTDSLSLHLYPGVRLLILSENGETPARVAALLAARGYGDSPMSVLERMGGGGESRRDGTAADWGDTPAADLNTIAVECVAGPGAVILSRLAGLPDDAFEHDGMMTKREVRAATLAALAPLPGQLLWDVGAGCGSIAIEWMRVGGRAIGIESNPARAAIAARNAAALGVPDLELVIGEAPTVLDALEPPDSVFIGGGLRTEGLFDACWSALKPGGKIVANAVTDESAALLAKLRISHGGEMIRITVSRAEGSATWKQMRPITQWTGVKS